MPRLTDFGVRKQHCGRYGGRSEGDANGDGQVDLSDFGLLKLNFGKSAPPAAVPEPSAGVLLALGAALARLRLAIWGRRVSSGR